jgi:hypothetical protein
MLTFYSPVDHVIEKMAVEAPRIRNHLLTIADLSRWILGEVRADLPYVREGGRRPSAHPSPGRRPGKILYVYRRSTRRRAP